MDLDCFATEVLEVSNIDVTSIDLMWEEYGDATEWTIEYGPAGFALGTGETVTDTDGVAGITVTDLDSNLEYDFYVTANCTGSDSELSGPISATTLDSYCTPTFGNVEPITLVEIANVSNISDATLDGSPAYEDFTNITVEVNQDESYDIALEGNTGGNFENFFTVFIDWNQNDLLDDEGEIYEIGSIENSTGEDGQQATGTISVPFDALLGTTRMRVFKNFNVSELDPCSITNGFGQAEDYTVNVSEMLPCEIPTDVTVTNITDTTADVSWTSNGGETAWNVIYGPTGFDPMTEGTTVTDNDAIGITLTDLDPETPYDVYVVAVCSENNLSDMSDVAIFTTMQEACEVPTDVTISNETDTTADVSWTSNGDETAWNVIYGPTGFDPMTEGTTLTDDDGTLGITLTDLDPETPYDVYVVAVCADDNLSDMSDVATFTTQEACAAPTDVTISNETDTTADVSWTSNGDETAWNVIYGPTGFDPLTEGITVTDDDAIGITINGLDPETPYDVYVVAVCDEDTSSDLSDVVTFTTEEMSVANANFVGFNFYPNPVKNVLHLEARTAINNVTVYDLLGKQVISKKYNNLNTDLDLSNLSSGTYMIMVQIGNQVKTLRVMKE
jgi:hypothetical protein